MKIELNVDIINKNDGWHLFLEKELEMDFLPDVGEEIEDNGLSFKVDSRTFHLEKYVHIMLEPVFEIINDRDKKEVLKRMQESGWTYRGDSNFDILKM